MDPRSQVCGQRIDTPVAEAVSSVVALCSPRLRRTPLLESHKRHRVYDIPESPPMHRTPSQAAGGVHGSWRSIALTSSEKSIRDLARAVKLERQHGEALRLIDVPVVFGNLDHIFDRLPNNLDQSNFKGWKKDTFKN